MRRDAQGKEKTLAAKPPRSPFVCVLHFHSHPQVDTVPYLDLVSVVNEHKLARVGGVAKSFLHVFGAVGPEARVKLTAHARAQLLERKHLAHPPDGFRRVHRAVQTLAKQRAVP